MNNNFDDFHKFTKETTEALTAQAATLTNGLQAIAAETTDFAKKSYEAATAAGEKLMAAKTPDVAIQIQTEYVKTAYESLVAQATKLGELYTSLGKDLYKPVEQAISKAVAK